MNNRYIVKTEDLTTNEALCEASLEELRVLITLVSLSGRSTDEGEISRLASVSAARCGAALAFWEGAGVLKKESQAGIVEEFEERLLLGEIDEEPAVEVAATIRDESLALLIEECQTLAGTPSLPTRDVKNITALVSQYGMTAEYILTLAAYMASGGELKIKRLCDHAITLQRRGVDTVEALNDYIDNKSRGYENEYRRVMGIYGRSLSKSEQEYYSKWANDLGYSAEIVGEAYNIATLNTGKGDFRYMDKTLTEWHEAGCRTVSDCKTHSASHKVEKTQRPEKKYQKSKPETPRYGNFDVNEAFLNAIERSFSEEDD